MTIAFLGVEIVILAFLRSTGTYETFPEMAEFVAKFAIGGVFFFFFFFFFLLGFFPDIPTIIPSVSIPENLPRAIVDGANAKHFHFSNSLSQIIQECWHKSSYQYRGQSRRILVQLQGQST